MRLITGLTMVVLAVSVGGASAANTPTISVTPDSGIPGTTVTVDGTGFCVAGCSPVTITFDTSSGYKPVPVNDDGTFQTTITAPGGSPAGTRYITATQTNASGGQQAAQASFTYRFAQSSTAAPDSSLSGSDTPTTQPPLSTDASDGAVSTPPSVHATTTTSSSSNNAGTLNASDRTVTKGGSSAILWIIVGTAAGLVAAAIAIATARRRRGRTTDPH